MSKIIIFPTDTVYGIGCGILDVESRKKICDIKGRSYDKPFAVLCANLEQIKEIVILNELSLKLIKKYFPGPLTIILKAKKEITEKIGYETLGIRIPNNQLAIDLLLKEGPMMTTSVNESGHIPLNNYEEIKNFYGSIVDEIYKDNNNSISSNIASTVVNCSNNMLEIVRVGEISLPELIKNV